jgi:hypothetical protein
VAGVGTPIVDASASLLQDFSFTGGLSTGDGGQPVLISGYSGTALLATHPPTDNPGNVPWFSMRQKGGSPVVELNNQPLTAMGTGRVNYALALPGAPSSCVVTTGGTVPVGTMVYSLTAVDFDGNETTLGPSASVTTTRGNQTVSCNLPSLPPGAKGFDLYRNSFRVVVGARCASPQLSGTSFTDSGTGCGNSAPAVNTAGSSFISNSGISTYQLRVGSETISASPRGVLNAFLPGSLTSTWTGETWTLDKAVTITRIQVQAKTAPSRCTTDAVVRLTDGTTPVNLTISGAANDSGAVTQNYAAGASLTVSVQTAAAGCSTAPADANAVIQYKMQ